jgi:hypothetical protein
MLCIIQCNQSKDHIDLKSDAEKIESPLLLKSSTSGWKIEMSWEPSSLSRKIRFAKDNEQFCEWFNVDLKNRRSPFRFVEGSVDFTTMGEYQPGVTVSLAGRNWSVTVCHEDANFVSQDAFDEYLQWESNKKAGIYALDKNGLMVTCRIQDDANGRSFDLEVFSITIAGKKPSESLLAEYTTGTVSNCRLPKVH